MSKLKLYEQTDIEYLRLKLFSDYANMLLDKTDSTCLIEIEETYVDFGQNWKYTALITFDLKDKSTWQSLNFRDYEAIVSCDSVSEIKIYAEAYVRGLLNGEICQRLTFK